MHCLGSYTKETLLAAGFEMAADPTLGRPMALNRLLGAVGELEQQGTSQTTDMEHLERLQARSLCPNLHTSTSEVDDLIRALRVTHRRYPFAGTTLVKMRRRPSLALPAVDAWYPEDAQAAARPAVCKSTILLLACYNLLDGD
jgi:hypothetical protein